jgi:hypothetical protein
MEETLRKATPPELESLNRKWIQDRRLHHFICTAAIQSNASFASRSPEKNGDRMLAVSPAEH